MKTSAFPVFISVLLFASCGGPCAVHEVLQREVSPNGEAEAVVYVRNCGPTIPYITEIVVTENVGETITGPGNVFSLRGNYVPEDARPPTGYLAEVMWEDNTHLKVRFDSAGEVIYAVTKLGRLDIDHQPF